MLVGALTGCTSESSPRKVPDGLPDKNRDRYVLPLDRYSMQQVDVPSIARELVVKRCLLDKGWPWAASAATLGATTGPSYSSIGRRIFTLPLAEKYGYGTSDLLDLPVAVLQNEHEDYQRNLHVSPRAEPDMELCWSEANEVVGIPKGDRDFSLVEGLTNDAYKKASERKEVIAATEQWRSCLAPVGVPDLEKSPEDMPPDSLESDEPAIDPPATFGGDVPTSEERRVAVADAKCRESSGYARAIYQAEWDEQVTALGENADSLDRYDKQMQKMNRKALTVIAEYAPRAE